MRLRGNEALPAANCRIAVPARTPNDFRMTTKAASANGLSGTEAGNLGGTRTGVMSATRFYRLSLWLPLLMPIIAFPFIGGRDDQSPIPVLAPIAMLVVLAGLFGAIPYLCTAFPLWLWMRRRPSSAIRRALMIFPVLLLGAVVLVLVPLSWWDSQRQIIAGPPTWNMFVPWNLLGSVAMLIFLLGYPYIWLVLRIGQRLERRDSAHPNTNEVA